MPDGIWLSILTVAAMGIARIMTSGEHIIYKEVNNGQV
jgi:hypothetical protein